jgi:hypothetical protein
MAAALAQSAGSVAAGGGSDLFMRFTKFGEWMFGTDNTEVEEGSIWAVNPTGFTHGFIAWDQENTSKGPTGEVMVSATLPMPLQESLPAVTGSWAKCVGIQLRCTNGEDEGLQVVFKSSSTGGRKAYADMVQAVVAQLGKDPATPVPLVSLEADSYAHKTYGKIFTPKIVIVGWAGMDGAAQEAEEPAAPEEEKPRQRRRRAS